MERAKRRVIASSFFEVDILRQEVNDIQPRLDLFGDRHPCLVFTRPKSHYTYVRIFMQKGNIPISSRIEHRSRFKYLPAPLSEAARYCNITNSYNWSLQNLCQPLKYRTDELKDCVNAQAT